MIIDIALSATMSILLKEALVWIDWSGFYVEKKNVSLLGWIGCSTCFIVFVGQIIKFSAEITNMETIASILEVLPSLLLVRLK